MVKALRHRGPDDSAQCAHHHPPWVVDLGHTRLSILDLSPQARQPIFNEDHRYCLVCNGEIYGFQTLRRHLETQGHIFRSHTDSEVLVHLAEQFSGKEMLSRISGMYAFGLWDTVRGELLLARDRIGKKPLYYVHSADGSLAFASEIGALVDGGFVNRRNIDKVALLQFWMYGYTTGERTIYADVRRLPAGHYAVWKDGKLVVRPYWKLLNPEPVVPARSMDSIADEIESLLVAAIQTRLVSDVPIGLFLSGGIDSSLVAAIAARLTDGDIDAYTIGFTEESYDETKHAATIARHLGLRHTVLQVAPNHLSQSEEVMSHFGEPFGDSSALPTRELCRLARTHIKVALTGDGGDELFAGYANYREGLRLWGTLRQRWAFAESRGWFRHLQDIGNRLYPASKRLDRWERLCGNRHLKAILSKNIVTGANMRQAVEPRRCCREGIGTDDLLAAMQRVNIHTYLPDDILVKVDRMSMWHGLECRNPLLDQRVVELSATLPLSAKMDQNGNGKVILKKVLERYVPRALTDRPKQGFAVPWSRWCSGVMREGLRKRWRNLGCPYVRRDAANLLFPEDREGSTALQWNALAMIVFWENLVRSGRSDGSFVEDSHTCVS